MDFYGNQVEVDEDNNQINIGNIVEADPEDEHEADPYNPKDIRNYNQSPFGTRSSKVHPMVKKHNRADLPEEVDPFSNNVLVKAK